MKVTKFIPNAITRRAGRQMLIAQKHSPRLLFGVGVVGVLAGTVLACKATLKITDVLDQVEDDIRGVRKDLVGTEGYRKDLVFVYARGGYKIAKLYAPAVIVTGASVGALTGAHITLTRRNAGLTAAYAVMAKGFDEYRERVREELGEDKERAFYHALTEEKFVDEDGKKTVVQVSDPNRFSIYAKFFDEGSPNWQKNAELNRLFVQCQQNYANHQLAARGHVFLNEVYDSLGIERTSAGSQVGWVAGHGDNYIDFGMFEAGSSRFINGEERNIILDFNVDGVIWDLI